jgi:hypothetical protein
MKSYYKRFQASTADNASFQSLTCCLWLIDPVPLPPNESLLDIPYHRYPNHLDDPNFQFSSLVTSDRAKMALKLQVGHAQGVNGKVGVEIRVVARPSMLSLLTLQYADGMKSGVKSANQRRKVCLLLHQVQNAH